MSVTSKSGLAESLQAAIEGYRNRNPKSAAMLDRARAVMPGGNTRTSLWSDPFPLCIESAEGCRIRDVDGHEYIDFLGEFTAGIFGHTSPVLAEAVAQAHADGFGLSSHTPYEVAFAERIVERFPSMDRLRFANSGTEANMMAVMAAKLTTGRGKIAVFDGAYHGGFLSFGHGSSPVNAPFDYLLLPFNDAAAASTAFAAEGSEIAAVLVEPMQGAGGCRVADRAFLEVLRNLTQTHGAILIFDEVQTARMSYGGAQSIFGVIPDMTTIGKFFGGGMAFGAFGGRADIMDRFDPARPGALPHAGTFNNNRLTMAAGLAAIDTYLTADKLTALYQTGEDLQAAIKDIFKRTGAPFKITGMGSIMNIHAEGTTPEEALTRQKLLRFRLLEDGYFIADRGLIAVSQAIEEKHIEGFLQSLEKVAATCP
ncbi:aspartate aminotransferase family protein [Roseibium litorale]|uniref:Aminotransferase class III-fold pyridoxal phosphate-dependent enzyme n=1 Tax=Roseibium litorale TaxID=2803841 RepID=A0ABR9CTK8_9HYPH|nr:aminotransferase class III-fold pyridoxal phosphate-dependent enzyme [Roseibium litorale]MBD8893622.1 aminotransferase class III-fold pyridoxal phosphate-dependent enzyme [Roseibium litorale]